MSRFYFLKSPLVGVTLLYLLILTILSTAVDGEKFELRRGTESVVSSLPKVQLALGLAEEPPFEGDLPKVCLFGIDI